MSVSGDHSNKVIPCLYQGKQPSFHWHSVASRLRGNATQAKHGRTTSESTWSTCIIRVPKSKSNGLESLNLILPLNIAMTAGPMGPPFPETVWQRQVNPSLRATNPCRKRGKGRISGHILELLSASMDIYGP